MQFIIEIKTLIQSARTKAYQAINSAMIEAYWEIGKRIVEEEQNGNQRASYGQEIIKKLSIELTEEFGKGFSERTLREFRQFYNYFPNLEIWRTAFAKLSWSHFQRVLKLSDVKARTYYLNESIENTWSIRTLDRQISTLYFERLISTQQLTGHPMQEVDKVVIDSNDFIKNPTVLEFLNLPSGMSYSEEMFEKALVDNLQKFILELGKGFAFVERQQHIRTETADFYIDLVFYNFKMKCFVLIELKTNKLTHQDIGQLDMYVRMYDDLKRGTDDNPTLGILLCTETDKTIAKYSVLNQNEQLFASKYLPFLPTEAELIEEIEKERLKFKLINQDDNG
ncbi:MAG: PDDEXK nuclease domain-containing protein [Crocinitomicaceae bacterium]|jgi:predicted nuclease of restriction endonuclease-like (RecB) superfamily|nr:PDDEXK nuclease domain-containing protein [Crocinitomicaceae bacterium]